MHRRVVINDYCYFFEYVYVNFVRGVFRGVDTAAYFWVEVVPFQLPIES